MTELFKRRKRLAIEDSEDEKENVSPDHSATIRPLHVSSRLQATTTDGLRDGAIKKQRGTFHVLENRELSAHLNGSGYRGSSGTFDQSDVDTSLAHTRQPARQLQQQQARSRINELYREYPQIKEIVWDDEYSGAASSTSNSSEQVLQPDTGSYPDTSDSSVITTVQELAMIIAIARFSSIVPEQKIVKAHDRNHELFKIGLSVHRSMHSNCDCSPEERSITLNGLSSNDSAFFDTDRRTRVQKLVETLMQLRDSRENREIQVVVSTCDGLFTNPIAFILLFADFQTLDITYVVNGLQGEPPRLFKVKDIMRCTHEIYNSILKDDPTHQLIRQMLMVAVGKLVNNQGIYIFRKLSQSRNSAPMYTEEDMENAYVGEFTHHDPTYRMYRAFQEIDHEGTPTLHYHEETRVTLQPSGDGLACPVPGCLASAPTKVELIAHIIHHIHHGVCPLCPATEKLLRYRRKLDVIHHVERHITPPSPDKTNRIYECPFCYASHPGRNTSLHHIRVVHFRSHEILTLAEKAGCLPNPREYIEHTVPTMHSMAKELAIWDLGRPLQDSKYDGVCRGNSLVVDEKEFCAFYLRNSMDLNSPGHLYDSVDLMGVGNRFKRDEQVRKIGVCFRENGRFNCPIGCCNETFARNDTQAAYHIIERMDLNKTNGTCPFCNESLSVLRGHIQRHLPLTLRCGHQGCRHVTDNDEGFRRHAVKHHNGVIEHHSGGTSNSVGDLPGFRRVEEEVGGAAGDTGFFRSESGAGDRSTKEPLSTNTSGYPHGHDLTPKADQMNDDVRQLTYVPKPRLNRYKGGRLSASKAAELAVNFTFDDQGRVFCPIEGCCKRTFRRDDWSLPDHVLDFHGIPRRPVKDKKDKCPYCGKEFAAIRNHLATHLPLLRKCRFCTFESNIFVNVKRHEDTKHGSDNAVRQTEG